ncbi:MAG: hypothetical protein EPO26_11480 [Chloroflexota bacterium]|nr:MAG: hypothetical protein EPO26_11480 [Chloroflexota bacterium]
MSASLAWPARVAVALLFLAFVAWAVLWHALPWALDRLPWGAPVALFLTIALASIAWATVDVARGKPGTGEKVSADR